MRRFTVLSGCSGGGKSTLLEALAALGFATVPEPGRRIVARAATPLGPEAFARHAMDVSMTDWQQAQAREGRVFFDRGLVDAVAAFVHATNITPPEAEGLGSRYDSPVFLVPPWPEIYVTDTERQHGFSEAVAEYERLCKIYPRFGYKVITLPKAPTVERVAFVVSHLG
ncbi:AAA family ATPase [Pararhodobacter sp.]|uniref:AAA family ATPase n=1 Tax=Pararhodobacter sp. TaxID=2127056 RepID=UPI002AFE2737|nr:AAA family ATPase [Pararhodobacter sp.]